MKNTLKKTTTTILLIMLSGKIQKGGAWIFFSRL